LKKLDPARWHAASLAAHNADYEPMAQCIARALGQK
jgi:hypothetical protein